MRLRHLLIGYLFLFLMLQPFGALAETPYMEAVDDADRAAGKGEWFKAVEAIDRALRLEPDNPGNILLLSNLGMIQFNMGQDSLAVVTLSEAHNRAPRSVTILTNRAGILASTGRYAEALADYARVIELDSADTNARFNHGLLSLRRRKFADAKDDFDWLVSNHPDLSETKLGQAALHCAVGEYEEAIPYYTDILEQQKVAEYYGARAYCYLMTDRLQEASDDIAAALELTPDDGELYLYRAALNKMRYRPEDARADAVRAVELGVAAERAREFMR